MTSSQHATEAEFTARQSLDSQIADVDGVGKKEKAGRKDPDAAFNGTIPFIPNEKEEENQQEEPEQKETGSAVETDDDENDDENDEAVSRYRFRFNKDNMIEIFDTEQNKIIRKISPENATKAIKDLSKLPGVLVNKKI